MPGLLALAILFSRDNQAQSRGTPLTGEELRQYNKRYLTVVCCIFGPIFAVLITLCICS